MLLNCHTYYSFGYGTLSIKELIASAKKNGYDRFVLSDINNTSAILDTLRQCREQNIKVIAGIDLRIGIRQLYVGIAKNNNGFKELNKFLSAHLHGGKDLPLRAPELSDVFFVYPFSNFPEGDLTENEFVGVSSRDLAQLPFLSRKVDPHKMVVLQPFSFLSKKQFNAHRLLRAIDTNNLLSKLPATEQATGHELILPKDELYALFSEHREAIWNTEQILSECGLDFEFNKLANKNLKHYTGSISEDIALLRQLAEDGLKYRYPTPTDEVLKRLNKELEIIAEKRFASYYLINWDIISYARSKNYFYVGRGSGANSIVAYLLKITDVDPIDLDLYFERFINEHRSNAPDFDIDFSWTDRDDITAYIFEKFGSERTALLGTYSTYQHDAVIRELGKVFGLPASEIEKLQKTNINSADQVGKLVLKYAELIQGFPSHLSIHASGILISEEPINTYTGTFMPPKGYPTTQFSMLEAEDIGLFKFDILSQRGLGKIKDALGIISENKKEDVDIHDIRKFKNDGQIKQLLRVGKCIGCFYVESPGMRMLLAKLQADDYLRLVAASSIIRPGVSKSGMMREYIVRYRNEEKRNQAREQLPELYDLLEETYGVMVYQEDVIKIAHIFAGLSLADADYLRRGMSWKFKQRNEFHMVKNKFFENCFKKGYSSATINDIWIQIESFANFAFSKGHSASYAVESYQALYLKAHYPLEYMVATLNNGGGFYRKEIYLHEARMHGGEIVPPCINTSTANSNIIGKTIYLGLELIAELEQGLIKTAISEREENGPYSDLYNFIRRTKVSIEQVRILIRAGAFHFTGKNKKELMWEAHMLINPVAKKEKTNELFDLTPAKYELPPLENSWLDDALDEIELFGFSLCSPFKLLKENIKNTLTSPELKKMIGQTVEIIGYLVTAKNTSTGAGERMFFGTFLDIKGYWIDTVHFPQPARQYPFTGPGCYRIIGRVTEEFDFLCIEVTHQYRLAMVNKDDLSQIESPALI